MRIEPVEDIFDDGQPTERLTICKGGHRDPYQCPRDATYRQTRGELRGSVGLAASRAVAEWAVEFA